MRYRPAWITFPRSDVLELDVFSGRDSTPKRATPWFMSVRAVLACVCARIELRVVFQRAGSRAERRCVRSECDDLCGLSVDCVHGMRVDLRGEVDSDDVWWLFHALYINLCFMGRTVDFNRSCVEDAR